MQLKERIQKLVEHLSEGMHERQEIIAVSFLGALSGQNTFLYGPPGTAKSLISRRIACGFEKPTYFECLMNRFSTPEEVFGPVSIKELKEDRYVRKTDGYLPTADFAFLDEIWKSSPAILNTLLTLINERRFRNGDQVQEVPLKALISASNETPEVNQGLDALYDRFILRLMVPPISQTENFERLLNGAPTSENVTIPPELIVKQEEWSAWQQEIQASVRLSKETLMIVHLIRTAIQDKSDELAVYASDRRWQRCAMLMKAAAFFNGRNETNHSDVLLLEHCLWTSAENREEIAEIVANAVREVGFRGEADLAAIDHSKNAVEKEINKDLYYTEDVYDTVSKDGAEYFEVEYKNPRNNSNATILIPFDRMKTVEEFKPLSQQGVVLNEVSCVFDGQGICKISGNSNYYYNSKSVDFEPTILFGKGDKKKGVNGRLVKAFVIQINQFKDDLISEIDCAEKLAGNYKKSMSSTFVSQQKTELAYQGVIEQIDRLKHRLLDCERLHGLCK